MRSIPLRSGFHIRPRRPRPRRGGARAPVSGPHSGHRLHPAFRIRRPALRSRPADGLPVYGKTTALIYKCIPGLGICFGIRRHRSTSAAHYTATRLHAYGATRHAQPNGGRAAHGRPRAMLPFLREVPSGPPESRLHLQAFIRNRAARLKIPGLNREASPAFPLTLCVNINRRARAPVFAETRAKICATEMTEQNISERYSTFPYLHYGFGKAHVSASTRPRSPRSGWPPALPRTRWGRGG